jgi:glycosyltransferase involved in cell wall biosynthesis
MEESRRFPGRLGVQQRVLPIYRASFFDLLAGSCTGGLSVFAGQPLPREGIAPADELQVADFTLARNRHIFDPSSSLYLCWQGGLLRWLEGWQPDVLIVEANPRYLSTRLAVHWMRQRGRMVVGWGLGAPVLSGPLASLRSWERLSLLRSLDGVIAYSRRGAEEYRALGLPAERVFVAPNAVEERPVAPPSSHPPVFGERPVVLFVGRLQARKRLDILFSACTALPVELQPRLIIVGDGPARAEFETLAQTIYPGTEFVGARHGSELEPYFAAADVFVLPGTGGLAVQQAMAHSLPVIVAQGDGTQDDLVRPENGWQVRPDDPEALRAALSTALNDPARLRQMGTESYRIVEEEVNLEAMVSAFVGVLNQLVR